MKCNSAMHLLNGIKLTMAIGLQPTWLSLNCTPKLLHDIVFLTLGQQKAEHYHNLDKNTHPFAQLPALQKNIGDGRVKSISNSRLIMLNSSVPLL